MKILNRSDILAAEQNAVSNGIFSLADLMKNAGEGAALVIAQKYNIKAKKILVVCGKGNNGGDGAVIAKRLLELGAYVSCVFPLGIPEKYPASEYVSDLKLPLLSGFDDEYDYIIDALFGIGYSYREDKAVQNVIDKINLCSGVKISVDIPSGIECDGAAEPVCAVRADFTVTFIAPKSCFYMPLTGEYCGEWTVVDIGIAPISYSYLTTPVPESIKRPAFANKGDFGTVLNICGNYGMCGAQIMSCLASLRSGAGIVRAIVNEKNYAPFCADVFEAVTVPVPCDIYGCSEIDANLLLRETEKSDAVLIGCGMGNSPAASAMIKNILLNINDIPVVIDADGINTVSSDINIIRKIKAPVIVTPHPKEMSRLCHTTVREIELDPVKYAKSFSMQNSCVVVLKFARTVIASPDGRVFFNTTGNAGMATGGSGDVLAGIIVSFLAQGQSPLKAALDGVYYHGLAADAALKSNNERSLLPRDIIEGLKTVL